MGRKRWTACKEETSVSPLVKTKKQKRRALWHPKEGMSIQKRASRPMDQYVSQAIRNSPENGEEEGKKAKMTGSDNKIGSAQTTADAAIGDMILEQRSCQKAESEISSEKETKARELEEKELTKMNKGDIKQFVIGLDEENPEEYKAHAEALYEAGVTGKALIADCSEGKEAFINALKSDYSINDKVFAKTLFIALGEKEGTSGRGQQGGLSAYPCSMCDSLLSRHQTRYVNIRWRTRRTN